MENIFVQIAAYRDPELVPTIKNCIANAKHPENLVFSISWQHSKNDAWDNLDEFINDKRFKIIDIDYSDSKGCCWARNLLQQQYAGETYTLQLDSHHRFVKDWDIILIKMYKDLQAKGYAKPLITAYLPQYNPSNDPEGRTMIPYKMNFDRFIPEGAVFFLPANIDNWKELTEPVRARFYSAHFAFTTGDFVKEVPHDPNYYFHGEEISVGVRAYTHGYDLFHPHVLVAWHEYTRNARTKVWVDDDKWYLKNEQSHLRNRKLFGMDNLERDIDFGIYDFGTVRSLEDYEKYAGLSFKRRSVQQYTIDNKEAPNPILPPEEYEKSWCRIFKHFIDIHKTQINVDDTKFVAVIFEDELGERLIHDEIFQDDLKKLFDKPGDFINILKEFETSKQPRKWIVWPYLISTNYWGNRIEGNI